MRILTEGFRAGKAAAMMPKIIKIINRRTKNDYAFSPMVGNWKDSRGKWSAYEAYSSSGEVLRFKFALGKSDVIKEVEYLESYLDNKSKYVIDLEGFNIVQVLDYITDVLTGEFAKYTGEKLAASVEDSKDVLKEALKVQDSIKKWILDGDLQNSIGNYSDRDLEDQLPVYNQFASHNNYRPTNSMSSFKYHIRQTLKKLNISNNIAAVSVVAGGTSSRIIDTTEANIFQNDIIENEHLIKFQLMELAIDRIRDGDPNLTGVYIYGTGGVGKSFYAKKELLPLSNVVYKSGAISGYTGLLEVLYENRHGMIIVLDDIVSPGLMKNGNVENIFKAVLDSDEPRHVEIVKATSGTSESFYKKDKIIFIEADFFDMDTLEDFASSEGIGIEEDKYDFDFTSKVVFITNIPHVPEAFADRVETVEMILTNEQIIDVIKSKLEFLATDVSTEDKYFFFDWLNENIRFAKKVSFRSYDQGLRLYLAVKERPNWESMIRVMLKSGVAAKY